MVICITGENSRLTHEVAQICVFLGDVYQHQSAAGYVQIMDALDMLNGTDRPTEEQVDRFDRLYTAALVH